MSAECILLSVEECENTPGKRVLSLLADASECKFEHTKIPGRKTAANQQSCPAHTLDSEAIEFSFILQPFRHLAEICSMLPHEPSTPTRPPSLDKDLNASHYLNFTPQSQEENESSTAQLNLFPSSKPQPRFSQPLVAAPLQTPAPPRRRPPRWPPAAAPRSGRSPREARLQARTVGGLPEKTGDVATGFSKPKSVSPQ